MEAYSVATAPSPDLHNTMASKDNDLSTEHFLMYGYKVVPCSKRYRHDWSVCPFAHTGEMAARRDPGRYLPIFCFHSKQRLPCPRGEECPYSHNLFEYWLHPQRYRTEMCQFGASCTRPVCFFAHGDHQLRHTGMPGGPQPVVAPPEPNPALPGAGYNTVTDPVLKQQQQLIALQQAAAGFSNGQLGSQIRSDSLLPVVDPMASGQGYNGMLDGGGSVDMGALQRQLSSVNSFANGLPASAPLSAPLPQLSPDLLAALNMSQNLSPAHPATLSPNNLLHNSIPANYQGVAGNRQLQRSFTAGLQDSEPALMGELAKQLAMMQLMQQNGVATASSPLSQMVNNGLDDSLMGQLAQLQQKQHQVAATAGLDFQSLLGNPIASAAMLQQDSSFSCPLPPVYSGSSVSALGPAATGGAAVLNVPKDALATDSADVQRQLQLGSLAAASRSSSSSEHGSHDVAAVASRRNTADGAADGGQPSQQDGAWSAPVSPCTSSKAGNDLQNAAADIRMSSISCTTGGRSSPSPSNNSNNTGSPSSANTSDNLAGLHSNNELREVALAGGLSGFGAAQRGGDGAPLLMVGDTPLQQAHLQAVLGGSDGHGAADGGMGKEKAAQLLGQLPESAVMKLLQLVARQS